MSASHHRKRASVGAFLPRDSKRLDDREALAPKRSFQNLRQLFKLPSRVLTPFSNNGSNDSSSNHSSNDKPRGRAPMVNQTEPRTHRLMGPISPTRTRGLPPSSSTVPNLRALAARNASNTYLPPPGRNISEPLPSPRPPQPNFATRPNLSRLRSSYIMNECPPAPRNDESTYSPTATEVKSEARSLSSARRAFTDITRRINSPQRHFPRLSLGPRNASTSSFLSVPYTATPTTSTYQQTSPPRPVFTNGQRLGHRAEQSLSVLNDENKRNSYGGGRPRATTTRDSLLATYAFTESASMRLKSFTTKNSLPTPHTYTESAALRPRISEATIAPTVTTTPPKPILTANPRCIYNAQSNSYWAGRFTALDDQYHTQMLYATLNDDKLLKSLLQSSNTTTKILQSELSNSSTGTTSFVDDSPPAKVVSALEWEDIRRFKRVFYTLQSLCVTEESKKSLWDFQLKFARERKIEACLPDGGTMDPTKPSKPWNRMDRSRSMTVGANTLGETF
jgi:hypothetical protein